MVVSEKIKMLKPSLAPHRVKYYKWRHNIFLRITYIHINVYNTVGVMLSTSNAGRQTMDAGP